jgi:TRAP-type C4-dicarboxylate transport system substrate-binding protein
MKLARQLSIAAAALAAATLASAPASAVELTFGSWPPAREHLNTTALPNAFKMIEKDSKGAITWKVVPGGSLANPRATHTAVQSGLMHGGLLISQYIPNVMPSLNTLYSTIVFDDDVVAASGAALEVMTLNCPSCIEEFKKFNGVALSGWTSSAYYLTCREPVKNLADLKGKRVRAAGGSADLMTALGAVPVNATLVEAVGLLQRGGLDCAFGVYTWLKTFGYADFAKYVTSTPLGITGPAINFWSREAWNKMTVDQKKSFLRAAAYISAELAIGQFILENESIRDELKKTKGLQIVQGDDAAFLKIANEFSKKQRTTNIADAKRFGVKDPEAIIDAYAKAREKWAKISKEVGRDIQKFAAAIQREIYDKVDLNKL